MKASASQCTREKIQENYFKKKPTYPNKLNSTFELAIDLPLYENVDVEFKRLIEAGAESIYEPRNEPWGMRSWMIADPEGNLIEIGSWNKGKK
jgi:lactoylglutathione lyase